jgi:hypothetical protein
MKPLQVWLPRLGRSVGLSQVARDVRRAYEEWQPRDDLMFMTPGLHKTERWTHEINGHTIVVRAIPAEHEDAIGIGHVGANGRIFAPFEPIHGLRAADLLDAWLKFDIRRSRLTVPFDVNAMVPHVVDGRVARASEGIEYEKKSIPLKGYVFPIVPLGSPDGRREIEIRWPPPEPDWPRTVHPDAESEEALIRIEDMEQAKNTALMVTWPHPFDHLFGWLGGLDVLKAHATMRSLVKSRDQVDALAKAKTRAAGYLSEGYSTRWHTSFWPDALQVHRDGEPIRPFWEGYGIKATTFKEAGLSEKLDELVPVTRAWGGLGLLWALLIERLESAQSVRTCPRCGTVVSGRRRECGPLDNAECYRKRRAETKRRSRTRLREALQEEPRQDIGQPRHSSPTG